MDELLRDHASFARPGMTSGGAPLQSRVDELEGEVARLREQLGRAKGVNDAMWEVVVRKVVREGAERDREGSAMEVDEEGEKGRAARGKRARV